MREKKSIIERQSDVGKFEFKIQYCAGVKFIKDSVSMDPTTSFPCWILSTSPESKKPVLFFVPGTASAVVFTKPSKDFCSHLAKELDCHVIMIIHRRSQHNLYPVPTNEVVRAINYYLNDTESKKINIDRDQVALGGYSSGGLLAIQACYYNLVFKRSPIPIRQLVLFAPVTNIAGNPKRVINKKKQLPVLPGLIADLPSQFIARSISPSHPMISPVNNTPETLKNFPRVIIVVGKDDYILPDIEDFCALLQGDKVRLIKLSDHNHTFPWNDWETAKYIPEALPISL